MWDLSLPGYKYLGPGNSLDKGEPTNYNDFIAYIHDIEYGKIIEKGGNPYLLWSEADAKAYRDFTTSDYGGALGKAFFGLKKVAYDAGLISKFELEKTSAPTLQGMPRFRPEKGPFQEFGIDSSGKATKRKVSDNIEPTDPETKKIKRDTPMPTTSESDVPMGEARAGTLAMSGGASKVSKETPVSPYPTLNYGLQETHTTILPYRSYCSLVLGGNSTLNYAGQKLELRLNGIWDPIITNIETTFNGTTNGFYSVPIIQASGSAARTNNGSFPIVMGTDPITGEGPAWRAYWARFYQYYTVLGCKYKICISSADANNTSELLIGYEYDGYTSSSGNVLPDATLGELFALKGIKYAKVQPKGTDSLTDGKDTIIEGEYTPGQVRRNIQNDGDVKLWTSTETAAVPTYTESLHMRFYKAPLNAESASTISAANIEIQMDYIVQFKDLKTTARYPITGATAISPSLPTDALVVSSGTAP